MVWSSRSAVSASLIILLIALCPFALADIPTIINYQGKVTESDNTVVPDGRYEIRFRIYDDDVLGNLEWDSGLDSVDVSDGIFSILLGESPHPAIELAFDEDYWLEVTVEGDDQIPRQRLASTGYAYMASGLVPGTVMAGSLSPPILQGVNAGTGAGIRGESAEGSGVRGETGSTISADAGVYGLATASTGNACGVLGRANSSNGYAGYFDGLAYFSDRIGIGTLSPDQVLSAVGTIRSASDATENDCIEIRHVGVNGILDWHGAGNLNIRYSNTTLVAVDQAGKVGIGAAAPGAKLDVRGDAVFNEGGGDYDFRIEGDANPNMVFVDASADRVGIGTDSPGHPLDVVGVSNADEIRASNSSGNERVRHGVTSDVGYMVAYSSNNSYNFLVTETVGSPNRGWVSVNDAIGGEQAGMYVDLSSNGIVWGDTKSFRAENPDQPGTEIWYTCVEGPEAGAYVRGTARLDKGRATIELPDHFVAVVTLEGMTVHLTPLADDSEGLAVVRKSLDGIDVRELGGGQGTYDFDYLVTAVRKGYEDYRVVRPATEMVVRQPDDR